MALIKQFETEFGVTANYVRIAAFSINYTKGQEGVQVTAFLYVNKDVREADKKPIEALNIHLNKDVLDFNTEITRSKMYEAIKTLPEFEGAEDA